MREMEIVWESKYVRVCTLPNSPDGFCSVVLKDEYAFLAARYQRYPILKFDYVLGEEFPEIQAKRVANIISSIAGEIRKGIFKNSGRVNNENKYYIEIIPPEQTPFPELFR